MEEIWKDIKGYEGMYQVSNLGRVKKITGDTYQLLKPQVEEKGYLRVQLTKNKKRRKYKIHRLVAENFVEVPSSILTVNHKNGDKTDNKPENLEWCTQKENVQHAWKTGLCKKKIGKENHGSKAINQYSLEGKFIKRWDCMSEVGRKLNINPTHISQVCKGKRNKTGGYIWRYAD